MPIKLLIFNWNLLFLRQEPIVKFIVFIGLVPSIMTYTLVNGKIYIVTHFL